MIISNPKAAYRVRLSLERTVAVVGQPWIEVDSEILFVYDDSPDSLGTVDAAKAARMAFAGVIQERTDRTVRGGKGVQ